MKPEFFPPKPFQWLLAALLATMAALGQSPPEGLAAISRETSVLNLGGEDRADAISREFSVLNLGPEDRPAAISREFSVLNLGPEETPVASSREYSVLNLGPEGRPSAISREYSVLNLDPNEVERPSAISREYSVLNLGPEERLSAISREYSVENALPEPTDLQVASVEARSASLLGGAPFVVIYAVTNASPNPAFGPRHDAIKLRPLAGGDDLLLASLPVTNDLAAGAIGWRTNTLIAPSGATGGFRLVVVVDSDQEVWEPGFEDNNTGISELALGLGTPDLAVTRLTLSASNVVAGATVEAEWVVENGGFTNATARWQDGLYLATASDALASARWLVSSVALKPLAAGESYTNRATVTLPLASDLPARDYVIVAFANADRVQPEATLANNSTAQPLTLTLPPLPDLAVAAFNLLAELVPGETVMLSLTVTNVGPAIATGGWRAGIGFVSGEVGGVTSESSLAEVEFPQPLEAGTVVTTNIALTLPAGLPAGPGRLVVRLDDANAIVEASENNNDVERPVTVPLALTWQLAVTEVAENAGPVTALLLRNGGLTNELTVTLSNSAPANLLLPATTQFGTNETSASVTLTPGYDSGITGSVAAQLTASASNHLAHTVTLTVLDVDRPMLTLTLETNRVVEGNYIIASVQRSGPAHVPVVVTFGSPTPSQFILPVPLTIPEGAGESSFTLITADDSLVEANQGYVVNVSAPGYSPAETNVFIEDDDVPALSLEISPATFSEGAGTSAAFLTVKRQQAPARALVVTLDNSNPAAVRVPATITIPAFNSVASIPLVAVDNGDVNPPQSATITAQARLTGTTTPIGASVQRTVTVTDDDGPTLSLILAQAAVGEGVATTATVRRNTGTTGDLVVVLASSDPTEATVPPTVTIRAGAAEQQFPVTSLTDAVSDGVKPVSITASAADYTSGQAALTVSDANLPDIVLTEVSGPATAYVGDFARITYGLANAGTEAFTNVIRQRVFLSRDAVPGDDLLLTNSLELRPTAAGLPPNSPPITATVTPTGFTFTEAGEYWPVVTADVEDAVTELNEANNTRIAGAPIRVLPDFSATVRVDLVNKVQPAGTGIPFVGSITVPPGRPIEGKRVDLYLQVREFKRVISAITDAQGKFRTVFQPLPGEAGHYTVGAAKGGERTAPVQDEFTLLGAKFEPKELTLRVDERSSLMVRAALINLSEVPLSGLTVEVLGSGNGLKATAGLINPGLPGNTAAEPGTTTVNFTLTADALSPLPGGEGQGEGGPPTQPKHLNLTVRVTSAEGTTHDLPLAVTIEPFRPRLITDPPELVAGMVRDTQKLVEFTVINDGRAETGPLSVVLPDAPWMTLVTTNPIPSLLPGASNTVTIRVIPDSSLKLVPYTGQLALNAAATSLTMPFTFRHVSEAKGDLTITAVDEYTYYAEGSPKVTNAAVVVRDTLNGTNEWHGVTGPTGELTLTNLTEGYYELEVSAKDHGTYRGTTLVVPGQTNDVTAFVARELVRYTWTVEPTEIEDRTKLVVESTFETVVPAPVITVNPMVIDLAEIAGDIANIELSITNHGLIAANDMVVNFPQHPLWKVVPLVNQIGTLGAQSSIRVPVKIERIRELGGLSSRSAIARASVGDDGPCSFAGQVCWQLLCGVTNHYCLGIQVMNARPDCKGPRGGREEEEEEGGGGKVYSSVDRPGGSIQWNSPSGTPHDTCDCSLLPILCLKGDQELNVGQALDSVVGSILKRIPAARIVDQDLKVSVSGEICTCCIKDQISWRAKAKISAEMNVTVEVGPGFAGSAGGAWKAPPFAEVKISAEAFVGFRFGLKANAEGFYEKECAGQSKWCVEASASASAFGGAEFEGSGSGKLGVEVEVGPGQIEVQVAEFSGQVNGKLGLEGSLQAKYQQCYGEDGKLEICGNLIARGNASGELKATIGSKEQKRGIVANYDEPILGAECEGTDGENERVHAVARNGLRSAGVVEGPFREVIPKDRFLSPDFRIAKGLRLDQSREGVCARVKLRLEQEAVLTRSAFKASLEVDNRDGSALRNLQVDLRFRAANSQEANEQFGVRSPLLDGITAVDGSGAIAPFSIGTATWVLIPALDAATNGPTQYLVGGTLTYTQDGTRVTVPLADVPITVYPGPELVVDYFHQRDVFSDDPFTKDEIEPAIPYSLGVMVRNVGRGEAKNFRITSSQPQIVENEKGLLIDFNLIATEVYGTNGLSLLTPSLKADFGNIEPGTNVIGRWLFTSALQGLFIDYSATFEHLDAIAGRRLSIITNVAIHEMSHIVAAPGAWDDGRPDFLLNEISDLGDLPDTVWLSDGSQQPVSLVEEASPLGILPPRGGELEVSVKAPRKFMYLRLPDPAGATGTLGVRLIAVRRPDGSEVPTDNFWQTDRTFIGYSSRPRRENMVHLFDHDSPGQYTLIYAPLAPVDITPPTSVVAALPERSAVQIPVRWSGTDDRAGALLFDVFVSDNEGLFLPWLRNTPLVAALYLGEAGHRYQFYSVATDAAGNREPNLSGLIATTITTLVNHAPVWGPLPDRDLVEGDLLDLTLPVTDPDVGQTLNFTLLAGPPGLVLEARLGRLTWPTGEGNGPSESIVSVGVNDDGYPPLSVTNSFRLRVLETNAAPELAPIADAVVREGRLLSFSVSASDSDRPLNTLRYSLAPGAPPGITLDPITGEFRWTPREFDGPSTNELAITVTDNGKPPLSRTESFTVIVRDTLGDFRLSIGSTNLVAGTNGALPIRVVSALELDRVDFILQSPSEALTDVQVLQDSAEVGSAVLTPLTDGNFAVTLTAATGKSLEGDQTRAELRFNTLAAHSEIAPLRPTDVTGTDPLARQYRGAEQGGLVFIVANEPLIFAEPLLLTVYGVAGRSYRLESAEQLGPNPVWSPVAGYDFELPTEAPHLEIPLPTATKNQFLRVRELP